MSKVRDFAREIVSRQLEPAHVRQEGAAYIGQLDTFRRPLDQLRFRRSLEPAQTDAERGLSQSQGFRSASQVPVLGDHGEVFDVAQIHVTLSRLMGMQIPDN